MNVGSNTQKNGFKVLIDEKRCKGCEICVFSCPKRCLIMNTFKAKALILDNACCIGCLLCELRCPDLAIEVVKCNEER